jgi:membrane fusion protein, multidrug efflux system
MKGTWRSAEKVVRPAMVTFQLRRWRKAELRENVMRRRFILIITAVLIACIGGTAWRLGRQPAQGMSTNTPQTQAIPVTAGVSATANVPIYLSGLGTVQAFNTVTVKVRVDGQLDKVNFTEGQNVKAGDVLAQIDPRTFQAQLDQAVAKKALDEANLANAKRDLERYNMLAKTNAVPAQQFDTQRSLVAQQEAQVKLDQGAIDNAKTFLDYCTIVSPIDGRTGIRLLDQGNIVHATDTTGLVVITQLQPISVIFSLPEDQLGEVLKEMAVGPMKVVATPRADQRPLAEGTLALVDNQIDQTTGTLRLKATFPNENNALWPGQFVNIKLLVRTLQQAVTVPSTAVQRGPDGMYVYAIKPDMTVATQPINVLQMADGIAVIEKGLGAGTRLVVAGQYRLQPGSHVRAGAATGGN